MNHNFIFCTCISPFIMTIWTLSDLSRRVFFFFLKVKAIKQTTLTEVNTDL